MERDLPEAGFSQPGLVVTPAPARPVLAAEEHHGMEDEREGRAGAVVVEDEVVDDEPFRRL